MLEVYPYATLARLGVRDPRLAPRAPDEPDPEFSARIAEGLGADIDGLYDLAPGGHAADALVAAYTRWLYPDELEHPPADFNVASSWISLPQADAT